MLFRSKRLETVKYSTGERKMDKEITFLAKCDEYDEDTTDYKRTNFGYEADCTMQFTLDGDKTAGRVKFGTVNILLF